MTSQFIDPTPDPIPADRECRCNRPDAAHETGGPLCRTVTSPAAAVNALFAVSDGEPEWSAQYAGPGMSDPDSGVPIPSGWWITAHDGDPEGQLTGLHIDYAMNEKGAVIDESLARALVALLNGPVGRG